MSFGYFAKSHLGVKILATFIFVLPLVCGLAIPHPILNFLFSLASRPLLFLLLPISILAYFEAHVLNCADFLWRQIFRLTEASAEIFLPLHLQIQFSLFAIWFYILLLMICFLYFENKKVRRC